MRRRKGKIKVQHTLIEGLSPILERIAEWEEVESIIPGEIRTKGGVSKGGHSLSLKYRTKTGFKLMWRKGVSSQEVFVVCKKGREDDFLMKFREMFGGGGEQRQ